MGNVDVIPLALHGTLGLLFLPTSKKKKKERKKRTLARPQRAAGAAGAERLTPLNVEVDCLGLSLTLSPIE